MMAEKSLTVAEHVAENDLPFKGTSWTRQELQQFFKQARRVFKSTAIDIKVAPRHGSHGKLLIVTPRTTGSAVDRNKFRRRIKAIFSENKLNQSAFDWAYFAKPAVLGLSFSQLQEIVLKVHREQTEQHNIST